MEAAELIEPVSDLLRRVAGAEVLPRFGALRGDEVDHKVGDEAVTVADREAELAIFRGLAELLPEALLVGEESVSADPSLLESARSARISFVVDPIDGTSGFIAGSPDFAMMIALVVDGVTMAGWIHQPVHDRLYTAVAGAGARRDGIPLGPAPDRGSDRELRGILRTWLLGPERGPEVRRRAETLGPIGEGRLAAGIEYPRLAEGEIDYVFWWRTRVWDHAPGALLVAETGGSAARLDGSPYVPFDDRDGLLVTNDPSLHAPIRSVLAPSGRP